MRTTWRTLGVIAAAIIAGVAAWTWMRADVQQHGMTLNDHAARLRVLEETQRQVPLMARDIEWIRKAIERQQGERRTP